MVDTLQLLFNNLVCICIQFIFFWCTLLLVLALLDLAGVIRSVPIPLGF